MNIFLWISPSPLVLLHIFPTSSNVSFSSIYLEDRAPLSLQSFPFSISPNSFFISLSKILLRSLALYLTSDNNAWRFTILVPLPPLVSAASVLTPRTDRNPLYLLNDCWWWSWCRKIIKTSAHSSGRIAQACDRCRSKKIKCDGKLPQVLIPHTNHRSSLGWLRSAHNVSMSALNVRRRINWADGHSLEVTPRH